MEINSGNMRGTRRARWAGSAMLFLALVALAMGVAWLGTATGSAAQTGSGGAASPSPNVDAKQAGKPPAQSYRLSPERYEQAVSLARKEYTLYFVSVAWGIVILVLLLWTGGVAKLRDAAERASGNRWVQGLVFVPGLMLLLAMMHLPISVCWHWLSWRYELSIQRWGSWFWDWTKGELLSIGLGYILALILVSVIRWKPRTWWLYFWYASVPLALFLVFISPWFLDPLFNKFTPLQGQHPELVEAIGRLTQRAGVPIPPERMFLMQASAKTNQVNAYVTGIGASKRVVVWDTTIQKSQPEEVLEVVGHELGHYVLGHVWKGFLLSVGGSLVALYVAYRLLSFLLACWGDSWGVRGQEDWAALAVLLLIFQLLSFVGTPFENGFSRMLEHAADVYGLEVTHGIVPNTQEVAAREFQKEGEIDLADPNPSKFITFWLYSHPPLRERLEFSRDYDPWAKGEAPKYVK
jgi:Zn-dependent protease with chaperone function